MRLCLLILIVLMLPLTLHNAREFTVRVAAVMEGRDPGGDYVAYWAASKLSPQQAYDADSMREMELSLLDPTLRPEPLWEAQRAQLLRQPPVLLASASFLGAHHPAVGFMLCTLGEAFLLGVLLAVTTRWAARTSLAGAAWLSLSLAWPPTWEVFHLARWPAIVAAVAFLAALTWLRRGDSEEAGLCLGAMLVHQPLWVVPLALFLALTRRIRALRGLVIAAVLLSLLSLTLAGFEGMLQYLSAALEAPGNRYFAHFELMYNFRGLGERWWPSLSGPVAAVCSLATWGLASLTWRRPGRVEFHLALLALTLLLASPVTHGPDLLLLLPALALSSTGPAFLLVCGPLVWLSPLRDVVTLAMVGAFAFLVQKR